MQILYEDDQCVVLNKPANILVHVIPSKKGIEPTVVEWVLERYPTIRSVGDDTEFRPGIVHRLDRETSGVLVIAKTQKAFEKFKKQFAEHTIRKIYYALVQGRVMPRSGRIDKPIGLKEGSVKRTLRVHDAKMVKHASTLYRVKEEFRHHTLLEVEPETGRTHQIRVHLASIGHPVVGDRLYGGKRKASAPIDRQCLHAAKLTLRLPNGAPKTFEAPLPTDIEICLETLRKESKEQL